MIRDGALLVESVEQILESLQGWQNLPPAVVDKFDHPYSPCCMLRHKPAKAWPTAASCRWPTMLAQLTELELEGRVSNEAGRWFARAG